MTGAPGAVEEGEDYAHVRLRLALQRVGQEAQLERSQGSTDGSGDFFTIMTLPSDLEPGDYTLNLTLLDSSYKGSPLKIVGDTSIVITVE
jgi:hypothetical protein